MAVQLRTLVERLRASAPRRGTVAVFLAGFVLTGALSLAIDEWPKIHLPTFVLFVSVLIVYTIIAAEKTRRDIDKKLDQLELTTIGVFRAEKMYRRAIEDILSAKESILVIGPYLPPVETRVAPEEEERLKYHEAIEEVIRRRLADPSGGDFVYKRVVQSERAAEAASGVLTEDLLMESPPHYFSHCKQLYDLMQKNPDARVKVDIRVGEPIPSLPSVLMVDNRYLHIAFPTRRKREFGGTGETYLLKGAMVIEDRTGGGIGEFTAKVFHPIHQSSYEIYKTEG